jgi:hypothetical protein
MKYVQFLVVVCGLAVTLASPAFAQDARVKKMESLAQEVKADKKQVVAANLQLTGAEAKGFWPVYEAYQKDLASVNNRLATLIVAYADAWKKGAVADETAKKLVREMIAVDDAEVKLKRDYVPKLEKVLPGAKVVRYLQVENKIRAVVKYELADNIPLMQ